MIGSDGLPHDAFPHPRLWGTFPRVLGHYARERGLFTLEAAVHKMTGLPARRFGLAGRGLVQPGYCADLTVFDPRADRRHGDLRPPHHARCRHRRRLGERRGNLARRRGDRRARRAGGQTQLRDATEPTLAEATMGRNEPKAIAAARLAALRVDGDRLWRALMDLARIGATEKGGVRRLALTDLDGAGPRPRRRLVSRRGTCGARRSRRQHLRAARRARSRAQGRRRGQPRGHPAFRRQVRRQLRRAGGARGDAHAERPRHRDRGAARGRDLDQRGGHALHAGDDGFRGVGRPLRRGLHSRAARQRGQVRRRGARADRLCGRRADGRHRRRPRVRRLFRGAHRAGAGARRQGPADRRRRRRARPELVRRPGRGAWTRTPAPRRWRCAATPRSAPRAWSRPSTGSRSPRRPTVAGPSACWPSSRTRAT